MTNERANVSRPSALFALTRQRLAIIAALVVILCLGAWATFSVWNRQAPGELAQAHFDPLLSEQTRRTLDIGLGDHIHCAIEHKAKFLGEIQPEYAGLLPLTKEQLGGNYQVAAAHHCEVDNREFVHFVLKSKDATLSLAFTKKQGESFPDHAGAPTLKSEVPLYQGESSAYQIVGFEAGNHLAFVISDLGRNENLKVASLVARLVNDFFGRSETDAPAESQKRNRLRFSSMA
ncbi:MAG: hypothetical protein WKF30_01110 [Pyrinomonadaceae bacterium]